MSTTATNDSMSSQTHARPWLTRDRIALYGAIVLAIDLGYAGIKIWGAYVLNLPNFLAPGWDFSVFWSASWLAIHSGAASAYDVSLTERIVGPLQHLMHREMPTPWVYPPTFLLAVWPLALLPFYASYAAFLALGVAFSGFVFRRILPAMRGLWLPALAFPALWIALLSGQNSLFTLGLAAAGLVLLERRPWAAGVCIGLLAIKPQLAIVFPVALLFGRAWRALAAAAITAATFCMLAGVLLGFDTFSRFLDVLPQFGQFTARLAGNWPTGGMPTWFAVARHFGLSPAGAYLTQAAFAVPALALVAYLSLTRSRPELRAAAVGVASLLSQSYLLGYDLVWLALPIAFLTLDGRRHGWLRGDRAVLVATWLAPLGFFLSARLQLGLCMPLVMMAVLMIIFRRARMAGLPVRRAGGTLA